MLRPDVRLAPDPDVIAAEIVEDLRVALAAFEELQGALAS
jgi:hypothetical protein